MLRTLGLCLLLLLPSGAVWAEGPQYAINQNGTSPCVMAWSEADSFNVYLGPSKDALTRFVTGIPNTLQTSPQRTWSTPCPTTPGQYYWSVSSIGKDTIEEPRSFPVAFVIVDLSLPVVPQSITPFAAPQGSTVTVTVTGSGFLLSGQRGFYLVDSGIVPTGMTIVSDTIMTATLTIPLTEPVGTKLLTIGTAPGPNGSLVSGFTVLSNVSPPPFHIGSLVMTTAPILNVRATAGGTVLGIQTIGAQGTINDGPTSANGVVWWKVQFTSGVSGWVSQTYLTTR